jgi:hypothetical protein
VAPGIGRIEVRRKVTWPWFSAQVEMPMSSANGHSEDPERQARQAQFELESELRAGKDCRAEKLFDKYPALMKDPQRALDLLYAEYDTREELGTPLKRDDFYDRLSEWNEELFKQWKDDLEKTLDIHDHLRLGDFTMRVQDGQEVKLEEFQLLQELQSNSQCMVYRARQTSCGNRLVVLKVLTSVNPEDEIRFQNGAMQQAELKHAHVVPVYGMGTSKHGDKCFYMEYGQGGSLRRLVDRKPPASDRVALIVKILAKAMGSAHRYRVIHRDLKPDNVVLTAGGVPKLTDFGLGKRLDLPPDKTRSGTLIGTPEYMAPEAATGRVKEIGPLTDVYGLGAIFYQLLTRQPPFTGKNIVEVLNNVVTKNPVRPRRLVRNLDRRLESICLKCLEKKPQRRYRSAGQLADDLARWLKRERPVAHGWRTRAGRFVRRNSIATIAILALTFLVATGLPILYLTLPIVQRWQIEREIDRGETVELIPPTGWPRWFKFETGTTAITGIDAGRFYVQRNKTALVQLLRNPRCDHYILSAEVLHSFGNLGEVGIYFAGSEHVGPGGVYHGLVTLTFNDQGAPDGLPNRLLDFDVRLYGAPALNSSKRVSSFIGLPATNPAKSWRPLVVEVSLQLIRVRWGPGSGWDGSVSYEDVLSKAKVLREDAPAVYNQPRFTPEGSIGLFVTRGSACFRNVVFRPIHEQH